MFAKLPVRVLLLTLSLALESLANGESASARPVCRSNICWRLATGLHGSMSTKANELDPCEDWDEFICGNYGKLNHDELQMRPEQQEVNILTVMEDYIDRSLKKAVGNPHGDAHEDPAPFGSDKNTFERMRRYYSKCVQIKDVEQAYLEPLERILSGIHEIFRAFDIHHETKGNYNKDKASQLEEAYQRSTVNMYDKEAIRNATRRLSDYQIWGLAEFMPQQSVFNSSTMKIGVRPHVPRGLPRRDIYDSKKLRGRYTKILRRFLHKTWDTKWDGGHLKKTAENVVELEKKILDLLPDNEEWSHIKENTVKWTSKKFETIAPDLAIEGVIADQATIDGWASPPLDDLEVMFPEYWPVLQKLISRTPRDTFHAFLIWQAFVQTQYLFDHQLASDYRALQRDIAGTKENPPIEISCRARTAKHFGPILGSVFVNHTYTREADQAGSHIFRSLRRELVSTLKETPWTHNDTKGAAVQKATNMSGVVGFPRDPDILNWGDLKKYFIGAAVTTWNRSDEWTHAEDYLQMQAWYARKAWVNDLHKKPAKSDWSLNTFDVKMHYSHSKNQVTMPAGLMWEPVLSTELPSYANYGAFGSLAAEQMFQGFDTVGSTFAANGSLGDWLSRKDREAFRNRTRCFADKYDKINITLKGKDVYEIDGRAVLDDAIASTHGADAAYFAWRRNPLRHADDQLPGFQIYTDDQLFWMFRSAHYCSRERKQLLRHKVAAGDSLPNRVKTWAPLRDSLAWHRAFNCKPREPVCRIWGADTNSGKYNKLHFDGPNQVGNGSYGSNRVNTQDKGRDNPHYWVELDEQHRN